MKRTPLYAVQLQRFTSDSGGLRIRHCLVDRPVEVNQRVRLKGESAWWIVAGVWPREFVSVAEAQRDWPVGGLTRSRTR